MSKPNIQRVFDIVNEHYNKARHTGYSVEAFQQLREETKRKFAEIGISEDMFDWTEEN
jgi:hypothetical protein